MLVGGVVGDKVDKNFELQLMGSHHQPIEVVEGAVLGVDIEIVRDVIAVIFLRRWIERGQPYGVDPEALQVIELGGNSREVADTVIV